MNRFHYVAAFMRTVVGWVLAAFALAVPVVVRAQILQVTPAFPTVEDTVTVIYDATQGTGGLKDISPVYAHTGVITSKSNDPGDWKYVVSPWGVDNPKVKMTSLGNNLHSIRFHIRSYYGIPTGEEVKQLAFVFRNVDGTREGKNPGGANIYYAVNSAGTFVAGLVTPQPNGSYQVGDTVRIRATASTDATLTLFDGATRLAQVTGKELNYAYILTPTITGARKLLFTAAQGAQTLRDSVIFTVRGTTPIGGFPAGVNRDGITVLNDSTVALMIYAPNKRYIYAMGDFNNWQTNDAALMTRTPDGERFWTTIGGLTPGKEYAFQYLVDGGIRVTDPYAEKILDPDNDGQIIRDNRYPNLLPYPTGKTTGIVGVFQTARKPYPWKTTNFKRASNKDLVIYELLVRDFTAKQSLKGAMDSLTYLKNLGVNCIELMPVMEYGGNQSWGYDPAFFCAVDKFYGTEDDLRRFIDSAHTLGMAVVLDMVLNHATGNCPLYRLYPSGSNPYFNAVATHPFSVFNDFNHEFDGTKYFVDRVNSFWLEKYKFDGFRFDLSKGFTQVNSGNDVAKWGRRDTTRIKLLKRMADKIWVYDPTAYVILEHFADNNEEIELSDYGMMLWGNSNYNYNEATMGYHGNGGQNSDFNWIWYGSRGWQKPNLVGYMESHDEERLMFKNEAYGNGSGAYQVKDTATALERIKMAAAFYFPIPGAKMIWQFGELGYDVPIDFNGRTGNKPLRWDYAADPRRKALANVFAALATLKTTQDVFSSSNVKLALNGAMKRISISSANNNVTIIGNFGVEPSTIVPNFQKTGVWYDFFGRTTRTVTDTAAEVMLKPGEFYIYSTTAFPAPQLGLVGSAQQPPRPTTTTASFAYPNPAQTAVEISYMLSVDAAVTLGIYTKMGEHVATLVSERQNAGNYSIVWDMFNKAGAPVGSDIYMYRLQTGGATQSGKIVVMR